MTYISEILILDDEREVADMTAEVLSLYIPQVRIRVAYTGEDAVRLAKEEKTRRSDL